MKVAILATLLSIATVQAFVPPSVSLSVRSLRSTALASATKDEEGKVYVASEVAEVGKKTKFEERFADTGVPTYQQTKSESDEKAGPRSYIGLVDGDTFDGGDGQVGVVGDGTNNMETFEENEVIKAVQAAKRVKGPTMVKESKARQMNAWGTNTGYAEELRKSGMTKVDDETGEDALKVRRQQFENYRNQQELQAQQRARIAQLDQLTGQDTDRAGNNWKRHSSRTYMDALTKGAGRADEAEAWNVYTPKAATTKSDGSEWGHVNLTGKEEITDTIPIVSRNQRINSHVINVKNTVNTFEPFHCEFVGEHEGFGVDPKAGTLNRRSGAPIPVTVTFKSKGPGDNRTATLVIESEEDKWVYKIEGITE